MLKNAAKGMIAAVAIVVTGAVGATEVAAIHGAGATFPYPVYTKWSEAYAGMTGIKQIIANTVYFAALDAPPSPRSLVRSGCCSFR